MGTGTGTCPCSELSPRGDVWGQVPVPVPEGLGGLDVDGAGLAAAVGLEVVGDALVAVEGLHPGGLDGADMDEGVVAAAVRLDEAIAFVGVEEFNGSDGHFAFSFTIGGTLIDPPVLREARRKKEPQSAKDRSFATGSGTQIGRAHV